MSQIRWEGIIGLNLQNTAFKSDILDKYFRGSIGNHKFSNLDLSKVIKWPNYLLQIEFNQSSFGPKGEGSPFKGGSF